MISTYVIDTSVREVGGVALAGAAGSALPGFPFGRRGAEGDDPELDGLGPCIPRSPLHLACTAVIIGVRIRAWVC